MANKADPYARIPRLPVGPLYMAQTLACAEGSVYRAAIVIGIAFWVSGCRTRPTSQGQLAALSRLPQSHIDRMEPALSDALSELLPMLETEWKRDRESATIRKAMSIIAARASAEVRRKRVKPTANDFPNAQIQPRKARKWKGDGTADVREYRESEEREHVAQTASVIADRQVTRKAGGLLSDKSGSGRK